MPRDPDYRRARERTYHPCPRPGCREQVPDALIACRADWLELPDDERDAFLTVARQRPRDPRLFAAAEEHVLNLLRALPPKARP